MNPPLSVRQNLTLGYFRDFAAVVLQLFDKEYERKRLGDKVVQRPIAQVVFLRAERHHAVVGGIAAIGVGSGNDGVAGPGRLLRRKRFG